MPPDIRNGSSDHIDLTYMFCCVEIYFKCLKILPGIHVALVSLALLFSHKLLFCSNSVCLSLINMDIYPT